jgi:general secretion pathway protein B
MSFILDALRKSEHERHRAATPGLADVAIVRRESRLPVILGVVGALLVVNAVALAVLLTRHSSSGTSSAASSVELPAATSAPPVPVAAPPAPVRPAAIAAPASTPVRDRAAPVRPLSNETEEAASDPSLDLEPPPPAATGVAVRRVAPTASTLPTVDQLAPQATAGLPPLNLDLHVYTVDTASRFVMIGGHRYREGDALESGPLVEQITPEGVVLNYRGNRFLLRHQ